VIISVDQTSPVPLFEQVRAQVVALVESGALGSGARLPSVRQLAGDLGVAPGTVVAAYQLLEAAGVTTSSRRHGTRIAESAAPSPAQRQRRLEELARDYALAAAQWEIEPEQARLTVLRALDVS